ncbi:MAG: radical SAM protein [Clostridiales bacterium]|jgi:nitrogen fixation protein NifB|nr:radical SAM protein [Clostridiales bacterium]
MIDGGGESLGLDGLIKERHPCFGEKRGKNGRVHLPVASACNISCRFCRRAFNGSEDRPGVASGIMNADQALARIGEALEFCPEITVAGIAGPGDALADAGALEVFRRIHERYPELILCMSTNGLMLPSYARDLNNVGVRAVTVTVNGTNSETVQRVVSEIRFAGNVYKDSYGAELLIKRQLEGIRLASEFAKVKVNIVLIPGVNDDAIGETARSVAEAGAELMNIIPLIPQHEFAGIIAPDCQAIQKAREAAEAHIPVFRHCCRCRADAFGIPGVKDGAFLTAGQSDTFSHG